MFHGYEICDDFSVGKNSKSNSGVSLTVGFPQGANPDRHSPVARLRQNSFPHGSSSTRRSVPKTEWSSSCLRAFDDFSHVHDCDDSHLEQVIESPKVFSFSIDRFNRSQEKEKSACAKN